MRFRKSNHSVYYTEYHIVWTPRYRRKLFVKGIDKYLENLLTNMEGLEEDIEVVRVKVQEDHVHIVLIIPPRLSVARVVQYMKSQSARRMREKFKYIQKAIRRGGLWSRGYCVSTVGLNERAILQYVEHQEKEDKGQLGLDLG
ncbi:MAG TPA: IS200/IS605 family transposase [Nitrospirae bacterium]|nr:IS200/IS605 family transposase [Nitrospirota bacterium]